MAMVPTAEESARVVLDLFVNYFKCRPSHVLRSNNFLATWHTTGLHNEDFSAGIAHAVEKGWVEVLTNGTYKLTETGFAAADAKSNVSPPSQPAQGGNFVSIGSVVNSVITQGIGSSQNITVSSAFQPQQLRSLVDSIRENMDQLGLGAEAKRKVDAQLATVEAQLIDEPNPSIVRDAFRTIRNVTEGAIGSLIASGAQPGIWSALSQALQAF